MKTSLTLLDKVELQDFHRAFLNRANSEHLKEINLVAFEKLIQNPWPKSTSDSFTYANLRRLLQTEIHLEKPEKPLFESEQILIKAIDFSPIWTTWVALQKQRIAQEKDFQVLLQLAFLSQMFFVQVPENTSFERAQINVIQSESLTSFVGLWIQSHKNSQATLELNIDAKNADLALFFDFDLKENAHLKVDHCSHNSAHRTLSVVQADLCAGAQFNLVSTDLGGLFNRQVITARLNGALANAEIHGLACTTQSEESHRYLTLEHNSPHSTSNQVFHQMASHESVVSTDGTVVIAKGSVQANSEQLLRSLLLSDKARAAGKPNLKIYCDDVKCSHGNTVGQLDAEELFYLQSRGLSPEKAHKTLIKAFAEEIIQEISSPELRAQFESHLLLKIGDSIA
jgi:Fe-S cluster assembly scaffold protein SufB